MTVQSNVDLDKGQSDQAGQGNVRMHFFFAHFAPFVPRKWMQTHFCIFFALFAPFALFALHFPPKKRTFLFFLTWSGPTANVSAWLARDFERTFYRYIK